MREQKRKRFGFPGHAGEADSLCSRGKPRLLFFPAGEGAGKPYPSRPSSLPMASRVSSGLPKAEKRK